MKSPPDGRRAALARDAAQLRLRRATQISVALMVALGGSFAALAAGSTPPKKTVVRVPVRGARAVALVTAPAPPLHAAQSSAPAADAPAPPAAAPAPSYAPPVVVSGGS
jgi:hypothetical protein